MLHLCCLNVFLQYLNPIQRLQTCCKQKTDKRVVRPELTSTRLDDVSFPGKSGSFVQVVATLCSPSSELCLESCAGCRRSFLDDLRLDNFTSRMVNQELQ